MLKDTPRRLMYTEFSDLTGQNESGPCGFFFHPLALLHYMQWYFLLFSGITVSEDKLRSVIITDVSLNSCPFVALPYLTNILLNRVFLNKYAIKPS